MDRFNSKNKSGDKSKDDSKDSSKGDSRDSPKDSKDNSKDNSRENSKEGDKNKLGDRSKSGSSKDESRNDSKDDSNEDPKDGSREGSKDDSKENKKSSTKDKSKNNSEDNSRENSRENSKESDKNKLGDRSKSASSKDESGEMSRNSSKEEKSKENSKEIAKNVSKQSSKSNSKDQNSKDNSRNNSQDDRSNRSTDEKRKQRLSKQQSTEQESTSSSTEKLLEDEEKKLLRQLENELEQTDKEQSSIDQEKEQNLYEPKTDEEDLNSNSSEKDKLIEERMKKRHFERRRSSSIFHDSESINWEKRALRSKFGRGSQVFLVDENLTMQIEGGKRRLSSFFSTSSNEETVITMEEGMTEEEMVENIKTHRQIIANTKTQHWPMHRKLKVLRKAKHYLKKHEGDMKQSSQAKDILAIYRNYIERAIRRLKREIDNLVVVLTPWEMRIKKIESQFGSVVASYFTFLRWIFWINTFVGVSYVIFVMVPEVILFERKNYNSSRGLRKIKEEVDKPFLTTISDINEFEGFLKFSPIFYGYYDTDDEAPNLDFYYPLPLLYFVLTLVLFLFSFFFILRKMTQNAKLQRIGTKEDEYTFCWKLYTGWDFMIGNSETAHNKVAAIVMGLKEVILEEKEKKKEVRNWKLIVKRIIANLLILVILCSSAYAVVLVVERSQRIEAVNFFQRNEVNFVFAGLQFVCPHLFTMVAMLEDNHRC